MNPIDTDQYRHMVTRLQHDAFERGDTSMLEELLTEDFVDHGAPPDTPPGPAGMKAVIEFLHAGLDDLRYDIHQVLGEGDLVAFRCTVSATHARTFLGIPATGRRFSVDHQHLLRFRDGRICEHWATRDDLGMLRQPGAGPAS